MICAELSHNPYLLHTTVKFNGQEPKINSQIEKYEKLPLVDWVHLVPEIYYNEMNGYDFSLYFTGTRTDYEEVKKAFRNRGVSEEDVRIFHKNEMEDADVKRKKVDAFVLWLRNHPNHKFDFEEFWNRTAEFFEGAYPYILIRGFIPSNAELAFAIERVESANELKNTDLTSTPIVFYIDQETMIEFRRDLDVIVKRQDVRKEQLFFMLHPALDQAQVTRVICDLGVENPQVIDTYSDNLVLAFIRNYPVTEFVRKAIQVLHFEEEGIASILDVENKESTISNAGVRQEIDALDADLSALKKADEFFAQRDNYEAPYVFRDIPKVLIEQILKWKNRKTKIIGEKEIESAVHDYISFVRSGMDQFLSSMVTAYKEAGEKIKERFYLAFANTGIDPQYEPTDIRLLEVPEIMLPEMKTGLLELTIYEESKSDFFGFFKKTNDASEPVMAAVCYLDQWRTAVRDIITPVLEMYIEKCVQNLSEYYNSLAEKYHLQLSYLIERKTKSSGEMSTPK